MSPIAPLAGGYLLGSIPFGLLLTQAAGLGDIRRIGSGNIGATNVLRTGNRKLAAAVFALDFTKGLLAVLLARHLAGPFSGALAGLGAVLGHAFPPWLGFRGGKGVATGSGALLGAAWPAWLVGAAAWLLVAKLFRISSLGALASCTASVAAAFLLARTDVAWVMLATATLIVCRHAPNIRRLLAGTEPKIDEAR